MRCAQCGRSINPVNAISRTITHEMSDGFKYSQRLNYGPVCAMRLGIVRVAPRLKRKPSNFAMFGPRHAVRVDDGQINLFDFFGATV